MCGADIDNRVMASEIARFLSSGRPIRLPFQKYPCNCANCVPCCEVVFSFLESEAPLYCLWLPGIFEAHRRLRVMSSYGSFLGVDCKQGTL